jgi:hypothetical protein
MLQLIALVLQSVYATKSKGTGAFCRRLAVLETSRRETFIPLAGREIWRP